MRWRHRRLRGAEDAGSTYHEQLIYSGTDVVPNDETGIPDKALYDALKKEMENFEGRDNAITAERLEMLTYATCKVTVEGDLLMYRKTSGSILM